MRNRIIWIILVTCGVLWAAEKPVVSPIEKEAFEVEQMVKELPVKEQALKTKTYIGTIDAVMDQRVQDVNDVLVFAKEMVTKAKDVAEKLDLKVEKKDFIRAVIDRHGKIDEKEKQKQNVVFLDTVIELMNDPNTLPPVTDPNYVVMQEAWNGFFVACLEICTPK